MMMMRTDHVIEMIVEQELYGKGREGEALHFALDVSMNCFNDRKTYSARCGIQLLFYSMPSSRIVHVFSGTTKNPFSSIKEIKEWEHEASHDSCWRHVQIFNNTYMALADSVNEQLRYARHKEVAPNEMMQHNSFRRELYSWVKVKMSKDPNDKNNYRKLIEVLG